MTISIPLFSKSGRQLKIAPLTGESISRDMDSNSSLSDLRTDIALIYLLDRLRRSDRENTLLREAISEKDELLELAAMRLNGQKIPA